MACGVSEFLTSRDCDREARTAAMAFLARHPGPTVESGFFVLAHDRRRVLHFSVADHPSAAWTAQQIVEAFPEDTAPRFMIRDRDGIFGDQFRRRVQGLGIEEILTAPRSPWQNPFAEPLVGSVRRECLDHVSSSSVNAISMGS